MDKKKDIKANTKHSFTVAKECLFNEQKVLN